MPHISGSDVAGTVAEVGENVTTNIKVEIEWPHTQTWLAEYAINAHLEGNMMRQQASMGLSDRSAMGRLCADTHLPEVNVVNLPDNVSFTDAAGNFNGRHDSLAHACYWAKIRPGQTVLIMGGGSGMGIAGIQIAKLFNCDVIATAGNKEKMEKCWLGADFVVNHREPD